MFLSAGSRARPNRYQLFAPRGTALLFYMATTPLGWTKSVAQNDKALRIVSGGTGGTAGGTNAFSTVFAQTVVGNTTLSTAQLASHTHSLTLGFRVGTVTGNANFPEAADSTVGSFTGNPTGSSGSDNSHNHTITMSIQFIDVIIGTKS